MSMHLTIIAQISSTNEDICAILLYAGFTDRRGNTMIKAYCITRYLSEDNIRAVSRVCSDYGYDMTFLASSEEADGKVSDGEVLYCNNARLIGQMPELRWCHASSAGVNNFLATGAFGTGDIILTNSSGAYGRAISEHIIMVTLMLMRRMPEYSEITAAREWNQNLRIRSICGSHVAVVGTGNLGSTAAEKFKGLGAASVIGFSRSGRAREPFDEVYTIDEFEEHIGSADVIVMCVPDTPETHGLLSARKIDSVPKTAYIVNVGRGVTIDQEALIRALNEGRIAGAALDVVVPEPLPADHPLWTARNCIITPHSSGDMGLQHSVDVTVEIFCDNLRRYAEHRPLINVVDTEAGY